MKPKSEKQRRLIELQKTIIPQLELDLAALQNQINSMRSRLDKHKAECVVLALELTPPPVVHPKVSDHALIRYLERHHKFDLDKFRNEILTDERIKSIQFGAKEIKCNGLRFKIQDNVVVTIV